MSIIDNATAHFKEQMQNSLKKHHVEEWNADVYYYPTMSFKEQSKILDLQTTGKASEALIETIVIKARDENGNKLFTSADRTTLMHEADPNVLIRLAAVLNGVNFSLEDAEKN